MEENQTEFDKSRIEKLKSTLYSRDERMVPKEVRSTIEGAPSEVNRSWGGTPSFDLPLEMNSDGNGRFFKRFLIGSLIFFIISIFVAFFIFFGGLNMISSNNVDIQITSPTSTASGEEVDFGLSVLNQNSADLLGATLYIDYPDGVQPVASPLASSTSKLLSHDKVDLGDIAKGKQKDYALRTVIFGQKDAVKTFTFRLEYGVKGSNATFSKEKQYDVTISSSPLILNISAPSEVNSGQEVVLSVDLISNSPTPVEDTLMKVTYPYGFTYKSSSAAPLRDSTWLVGDLKNGDKKTIVIKGVLVGQDLEDRTFQVSAGTAPAGKDLSTALAVAQATVGIRKSFFGLSLHSIDGFSIAPGRATSLSIEYQNTLPDKITNSHIEAKISGNAFEPSSVGVSSGGFYRSSDAMVLWDKNSTDGLDAISPGDQGQVTFSVAPISNLAQMRSIKNPYIDIHVTMTGNRTGADTSELSSSADITLKVSSVLGLVAKVRRDGPFTNTGPFPPKADKESTYTVTWTLTNTNNDLAPVTVSATLPAGVSWKEQTAPASEKVSYNSDNRTVTWDAGNISAGSGFAISPREISFQIGFTPSLSQVGSAPAVLSETDASATDTYTNGQVAASAPSITTGAAVVK